MEFLKQYTNKLRSMNGTTDSNGIAKSGRSRTKTKRRCK